MKRLVTGLAAGALSILLLAPCVKAQSWQDVQNDRAAIESGRAHLHHDRKELRRDLRNGNYAAAAREKAEMNERRAAIAERKADLNNDIANRGNHHWRYHHFDED
jgi:hypothetical protein